MQSFDELHYGDELAYVGPDEHDPGAAWHNPYAFRHVSLHGTLALHTKHNGKKVLAPDHPANDPAHWTRGDDTTAAVEGSA